MRIHNLDLIQGCVEAASRIAFRFGSLPTRKTLWCWNLEKGTELEKCCQGRGSAPALAEAVFLGGWMCLGGDHEVLGGEEVAPASRMLWVPERVTQCNWGDKPVVNC